MVDFVRRRKAVAEEVVSFSIVPSWLEKSRINMRDFAQREAEEALARAQRYEVRLEEIRTQERDLFAQGQKVWKVAREPLPGFNIFRIFFGLSNVLVFWRPGPVCEPPKWGWWFLALLCGKDELEEYAGDVEEMFRRFAITRGRAAANWFYFCTVLHLSGRALGKLIGQVSKLAAIFGKAG